MDGTEGHYPKHTNAGIESQTLNFIRGSYTLSTHRHKEGDSTGWGLFEARG